MSDQEANNDTVAVVSEWKRKRQERKRQRAAQQQENNKRHYRETTRTFHLCLWRIENEKSKRHSWKLLWYKMILVPVEPRDGNKRMRHFTGEMSSRKRRNVWQSWMNSQRKNVTMKRKTNELKRQLKMNPRNQRRNMIAQSLLESAAALQSTRTDAQRANLHRQEEEARILKEASKVQTNALQAASELASGLVYTEPMPSTWTVPRYILKQGQEVWEQTRKEWHMEVEGSDIPPPMKRFKDMKFPKPLLDALEEKNIKRPTPIQMQGLPVALAGRDMVGIAFTGSGKTITFSLPLVMAALEEELRMPLIPGEGPIGIILAPSRELARQTFDVVSDFCARISKTPEYPQLRTQLLIGGESTRDQVNAIRQTGVHAIVATPGRLRDILKKRFMTLDICRYICLDEADRMLDLGFDEEVGEIMNFFPHQRQTLLFSATFPQKFQDFARTTLVKPIVVNVGRAGAANLDVIQEVEYVKQEAKIVYLLHCLQKTAPPAVIFCERKGDVDDIHEYLLLKGVEAVSIHGGKDQEERNEAIALYKAGEKDVLVATDIAAKGLDFADIQRKWCDLGYMSCL